MEPGSSTVTLTGASGTGEHAACATVLDGTGSGQYRKVVGWARGTPRAGACASSPVPCKEHGRTFCPTLKAKDQCDRPPQQCPPCPEAPPPPRGPPHNQTITLDLLTGKNHLVTVVHPEVYVVFANAVKLGREGV